MLVSRTCCLFLALLLSLSQALSGSSLSCLFCPSIFVLFLLSLCLCTAHPCVASEIKFDCGCQAVYLPLYQSILHLSSDHTAKGQYSNTHTHTRSLTHSNTRLHPYNTHSSMLFMCRNLTLHYIMLSQCCIYTHISGKIRFSHFIEFYTRLSSIAIYRLDSQTFLCFCQFVSFQLHFQLFLVNL